MSADWLPGLPPEPCGCDVRVFDPEAPKRRRYSVIRNAQYIGVRDLGRGSGAMSNGHPKPLGEEGYAALFITGPGPHDLLEIIPHEDVAKYIAWRPIPVPGGVDA